MVNIAKNMENNDKIWEKTLGELELLISKANFTTWFKNTFVAQLDGENITVGVPNAFTKVWLEKKYHKQILSALENVLSKNNLQVIYRVITKEKSTNISKKTVKEEPVKEEPVNNSIPKNETSNGATLAKFGLNPQYTFDTFVVGPGNELAQVASNAAANKPGEIYNPLFIYGGVGLGKTHLVQAVGNYILSKDPTKKVLYINSDDTVKVNMGVPNFEPSKIPLNLNQLSPEYEVEGYMVGSLSIGNPHAILIQDEITDIEDIASKIQSSMLFPDGVNVGFMKVLNKSEIELRVVERGVGETRACGSGACAAVIHGVRQGLLDPKVKVHLNGGDATVEFDGEKVHLTGPGKFVYEGSVNLRSGSS